MLAGVGFSTQGESKVHFLDGILDPRVAFMREGWRATRSPASILASAG